MTEAHDIKPDKTKGIGHAVKKTYEEKKPNITTDQKSVEITKMNTKKKNVTVLEVTTETGVGDDNTLLSNDVEESVPLNPIEQVTDHDAVSSSLSLRE